MKDEIRDYNYTLIFNDGLGGNISATIIVHLIDDRKEDPEPIDSDPESNSFGGFLILTISLLSIGGVIIIRKRLKSIK